MAKQRRSPTIRVAFAGVALLLYLLSGSPVHGQVDQFWPEFGFHKKLTSHSRFYFVAKSTRENREGVEIELGPNLDFYLKPILKLKTLPGVHVDESKSRPLILRVGYRYLASTQNPAENRGVIEVTGRIPLVCGAVISDRNRVDLRFIEGDFSWRYRNRLTVERAFSLRGVEFAPYLRAEAFFNSRFRTWSRTAFNAGGVFSFKKHWELEAYFEHQNDTGNNPNRQVNALGLIASLHI
jgi:hypothetical protein